MIKVDREQAAEQLGRLIEAAAAGQEVVITTPAGPTVQLVPIPLRSAEPDESAGDHPKKTIGHALDRFIGTWSAEQEAEILEAIEIFERVDEAFWR